MNKEQLEEYIKNQIIPSEHTHFSIPLNYLINENRQAIKKCLVDLDEMIELCIKYKLDFWYRYFMNDIVIYKNKEIK